MGKSIYSVSQINTYIEKMFQDDFMLGNLSISGEISNCKYNHTGHIYFTLKDEKSSISCVMFAGNRMKGLAFPMKDGDKVIVQGYVGVYSPAGKYQVYAKQINLAGVGDLYQRYEELKAKLEESGMFSEIYKKQIPTYAKRIGVVTAPTGAAVHDIIQVSKSRNPYVEIILYPAQVQGEAAIQSVITGIETLDTMNLDVIIVGRGGGSIEDLWAFNEESVAYAIFNCNTPVISAVGHETDFTIADYVADRRAATPSQAAEIANFRFDDFKNNLNRYSDRLSISFATKLDLYINKLNMYKRQMISLRPDSKIKIEVEKIEKYKNQLDFMMNQILLSKEKQLAIVAGKIDGLSPTKKLVNGFGFITDSNNNKVESVSQISEGDVMYTRISDGKIESRVTRIEKLSKI